MRVLTLPLALALATLASVAPAQQPTQPQPPAQPPTQPQRLPPAVTTDSLNNTVTVQNQRKVPVTVYMEYGKFDRRLGEVPPNDMKVLTLPDWVVNNHPTIRLFAHPEGEANDLQTSQFSLAPPARLAMVVPAFGAPTPPGPADTMSAVIPAEQLADATVTVDNQRNQPVTVFAVQGRFDTRLGSVGPLQTATLSFPKSVVLPGGDIRLIVHPEGSRDMSSQLLKIQEGKHIGLRVPKKGASP